MIGRGSGIDDPTWMRKTAAVRDALLTEEGFRSAQSVYAVLRAERPVSWHQPVSDQFVDPSGRFATGGLAVLVDSGLGAENHRRRPSGKWTVTTELRLDLIGAPREGSSNPSTGYL